MNNLLDTTILIVTIDVEGSNRLPNVGDVAAGCKRIALTEPGVDAVAVAIPINDWPTILFTAAGMRNAVELPGGAHVGPTAAIEGHDLVDTLCKHLEGVMPAWEVTEPAGKNRGNADLHEIAVRHASKAVTQIMDEGKRARQIPKRSAWQALPDGLDLKIARFVVAAANNESLSDVLAELDFGEER